MLTPPESIVGTNIRLRRSTRGDAQACMNGCADRWASGVEYHWAMPREGVLRMATCRPNIGGPRRATRPSMLSAEPTLDLASNHSSPTSRCPTLDP